MDRYNTEDPLAIQIRLLEIGDNKRAKPKNKEGGKKGDRHSAPKHRLTTKTARAIKGGTMSSKDTPKVE